MSNISWCQFCSTPTTIEETWIGWLIISNKKWISFYSVNEHIHFRHKLSLVFNLYSYTQIDSKLYNLMWEDKPSFHYFRTFHFTSTLNKIVGKGKIEWPRYLYSLSCSYLIRSYPANTPQNISKNEYIRWWLFSKFFGFIRYDNATRCNLFCWYSFKMIISIC